MRAAAPSSSSTTTSTTTSKSVRPTTTTRLAAFSPSPRAAPMLGGGGSGSATSARGAAAAPSSSRHQQRAARGPQPPRALLDQLTSFLTGGGNAGASSAAQKREAAKQELLDLIAPLQRGLAASEEDAAAVEAAAQRLERLNPTRSPLASPLINGKWELLYTTSDSILGRKKPAFLRPSGPIYQTLDTGALRARNRESAPLYNTVSADLKPLSESKVAVQFDEFGLFGGSVLRFKAPPSAKGELDMTYLDEALRVSRGDKGNLFVLRMVDRDAKP